MKCTRDNILRLLDIENESIQSAAQRFDANKDYQRGYADAIKNIRFVVSVVWEREE